MTTAVVFDYGFGNVRSMLRALANIGVDATLTSDHRQALEADGLVVPGVGAFAACMEGLKQVGGERIIYDRLRAGRPVLGICVGQQILFQRGNENGAEAQGLGLIGGSVERIQADVIPHMGWNTVETPAETMLLQGVEGERFYFVHSYAATQAAPIDGSLLQIDFGGQPQHVTWCQYGQTKFVAAYERGALSATQFHPEKSAEAGAQLLRNWVSSF